jgi:asparagine synthetase B (glutamine-hydrolysing)
MCGIFALLYNSHSNPNIKYKVIDLFNKIKGRGPEQSNIYNDITKKYSFGFHRLAINVLDLTSGQPLCYEKCIFLI